MRKIKAEKKVKHLLTINDLTTKDIGKIFKLTDKMKKNPRPILKGKTLAMLFAKPSTRTRVSFEVAMTQMGGHAIDLDFNDLQVKRGETIADTARVISRYADVIMARLFSHDHIVELARNSRVPVINGLTDLLHPCQALADIYTIKKSIGRLIGVKLVYLGDGNNNVTHSLMLICSKLGIDMIVSSPKNYFPNIDIIKQSHKNCKESGSDIRVIPDPKEAVKGADVLYTDSWTSMGEESEKNARIHVFARYQLDQELLKLAKKDCIVMHCLPAHRGYEIKSDVMDGKNSVIFDQAENRLHTEKAILSFLLNH
jgi:ornithine carbamoyltransferase